jgi:hypothetical protein
MGTRRGPEPEGFGQLVERVMRVSGLLTAMSDGNKAITQLLLDSRVEAENPGEELPRNEAIPVVEQLVGQGSNEQRWNGLGLLRPGAFSPPSETHDRDWS